jgi:hypothetical protein
MHQFPASRALLNRIGQRLYLARLGRSWYRAALIFGGLYAGLLLVSRLTGLIPDWFSPLTVIIPPLAAILLVLMWNRRPTPRDAAQYADRHAGTKDLYLTLTLLDDAAGEYKPLVGRDAEARAGEIEPRRVIAWGWRRPLVHVVGLLIVLGLGSFLLPSLDPFGRVAEAKETQRMQEDLRQSRRETEVRKSQLAKSDTDAETSEEIKKSLEDLQSELRRMEPREQRENDRVLAAHQKGLGEKWRFNAEQLKHLLNQKPLQQRFGSDRQVAAGNWLKQLQQGNPEELDRELEELQQELKAALEASDPLKRTEAIRRLQKKLDEMHKFARDQTNSRPLTAALERALKQLEAMKSSEMSKEASEAASESMKLASLELKQLAQSMRDLKELEKALEALQMAKKLNSEAKLDGEACENCQSMADYAELYAEMMAELGYDVAMGEGDGGLGRGERDEALQAMDEDETVKTDFKEEEAKSTIQKGKILLSLKTKGVSEEDGEELNLQYQAVVKDLQQSVSQAIDQEQIPPGYHEGIKKYFDSLETEAPAE